MFVLRELADRIRMTGVDGLGCWRLLQGLLSNAIKSAFTSLNWA